MKVIDALACKFGDADANLRAGRHSIINQAMDIPPGTASPVASTEADPPVLPGLPVLGDLREILRDTGALLVNATERLGQVYRVRVLWNSYVVIAGTAAVNFIREQFDEKYCSREKFFAPIEREFGKADLTLARSGERHSRLRTPLLLAFSRQVASAFVPDFVEAVRSVCGNLPAGSKHGVMDVVKRIAFEEYCQVMAGSAAGFNFRDCLLVAEYGMNVGGRVYPEAAFRLPWYRAAHRRALHILRELVAARRAKPATSDEPKHTIVDTLLSSKDTAGKMLTEEETVTYAAYGIAASCAYVSRLMGFMLYEILRDEDLKASVTAECDAAFVRGVRDAAYLPKMPRLRGIFLETLRLHPISPGMPFTAEKDFVYLGKRIRPGDTLVISPVPLAFSACPFHQPDKFDAARFEEPGGQHLKGEFHPFGLFQRSCVATGLVELMVVTAIATLLHERSLSLEPRGYRLRLRIRPLPSPDQRFRVRVATRTPDQAAAPSSQSEEAPALAVFPGHDDPVVAEVLREAATRSFEARARIIRQGDPADAFYIIMAGSVNVTRDSAGIARNLAELKVGDYFGEMGLLQNAPRNADVTAGADGARTLVLSREAFLKLVASSDLVAGEISSLAHRRAASF